jgi:deoxycytidylate deaminase
MKEYNHLKRLVKILKTRNERFNTGAVLLDKKGNLINYGFNSYVKTNPNMVSNPYYHECKIFVHAECDALYKCKQTSPHILIVARLSKNNTLMNSKPCIGCYYEILNSSVKKVYYTNKKGNLELLNLTVPIEDYTNSN